MGHANQVQPLKYILRYAAMTTFDISVTNSDGTRKVDSEAQQAAEVDSKGKKKAKGGKSNAAKIQFFLDQRKPPTEKLGSLCAEYDDDLNRLAPEN